MDEAMNGELSKLLSSWTEDPHNTKDCFLELKQALEGMDGVTLSLTARPGVSYSLRAAHAGQKTRGLFAMVDVIDDDPADRWLSVCFYKDMIGDPDELADEVPEGLLGEDARCFDLEERDENLVGYIKARLAEAGASAAAEQLN